MALQSRIVNRTPAPKSNVISYPAPVVTQIQRERLQYTPGNPLQPLAGVNFPGAQLGAPIEVIRDLIRKQTRMLGVPFTVPISAIGAQISVPVEGMSDGKIFLGISVTDGETVQRLVSEQFTLIINNEVIFQNLNVLGLMTGSTQSAFKTGMNVPFVSFPRPLSGQDDIVFTITNQAAVAINAHLGSIQIFYI